MNRTSRRGTARSASGRADAGQSLAEFALILPMLMLVMLGVIELGNAFTVSHALATISREGANLASRGTPLTEVLSVVISNGSDLRLDVRGGSVASRVTVVSGVPRVIDQLATPGYESQSLLGTRGSIASSLTGVGYLEGSSHYVVEVFYGYRPITPLANFLSGVLPDPIYERAVF